MICKIMLILMNYYYFQLCIHFQPQMFDKVWLQLVNLYLNFYNEVAYHHYHIIVHNILNHISYCYYIYLNLLNVFNKKLVDLHNHQGLSKFQILDFKCLDCFKLINFYWNHSKFQLVILYSLTSFLLFTKLL